MLPIAALSHDVQLEVAGARRRLVVGGALACTGVAALAVGMTGGLATTATFVLLGAGALLAFVGVNVLSPAFAGRVVSLLGRPISALFGVPGRLARDNAARNPRRTASTAGALMIGLSLMGLAAVVGESIKKTFTDIIDNAVEADYFIRSDQGGFDPNAGFPARLADEIEALEEISSVVRLQFTFDGISVDGETRDLVASDLDLAASHFDARVSSGDLASSDPLESLALHSDSASELGVAIGDRVAVTFPDGETDSLVVVAVYEDAAIFGNWLIDGALMGPAFQPQRADIRQRPHRRILRRSDGRAATDAATGQPRRN